MAFPCPQEFFLCKVKSGCLGVVALDPPIKSADDGGRSADDGGRSADDGDEVSAAFKAIACLGNWLEDAITVLQYPLRAQRHTMALRWWKPRLF